MTTEEIGSKSLKIAICIRKVAFGDGIGGLERAAGIHIEELIRGGHQISIYTPAAYLRGIAPEDANLLDIPWPKWDNGGGRPTMGLAYYLWVRRLRSELLSAQGSYDIIHFHGGSVGALKGLSSDLLGCSGTTANPHGMEEFERSILRYPNRFFLRRLVGCSKFATKIIATDSGLVPKVIKNTKANIDQIETIPNSIDIRRMASLTKPKLGNHNFSIVTIGRLAHNKGFDLLMNALKLDSVNSILPSDWKWIHFGSGSLRHDLTSRSNEIPRIPLEIRSGCSDEVVQEALSEASLFIQPSRYEGSSLTTLEAMFHGVTVVATPVGGIPDKISDGLTGYLAKDVSPESIGEAIVRALRAATPTGTAARLQVEERFSLESAGQQYVELYRRISLGDS